MNLAFVTAGIGLTLFAVALVAWPLIRKREEGAAPLAALCAGVGILVGTLVAYLVVSSYPWTAPPLNPAAPTPGESAALAALKTAVRAAPTEAAAWGQLGNALLGEERFADAQAAFRRAHELDRQDDSLLLSFAEATILNDRNQLVGEAGRVVESVLAREPANPKALWYGGMVAIGRGESAAAIDRWSRLLDLGPPPAVRSIVEQQLARMVQSVPDAAPVAANAAAEAAVALEISLESALTGQVKEGAVMFVFARQPGVAGPPLAVVRRPVGSWPLSLSISDADSMVPGRSMGGLAEIAITARIANDGEALPASGDLYGEATWRPGAPAPLAIRIDRALP